MEDVTDPEVVTTQEEPTSPSNTSDAKQTPATVETPTPNAGEQPTQGKPTGDLSVALKQEREQRKQLQRELAQLRGNKQIEGYDPEDLETLTKHPFVQDLLLQNATSTLKEGVKELLDQYPNIPKSVAKAILRNPRGYVNPGTQDVANGLIDIQDYLEEIAGEFQPASPEPQPKTVTVMGNNKSIGGQPQDADIKDIVDNIPPEEWTPAQEKAVDAYLKSKK